MSVCTRSSRSLMTCSMLSMLSAAWWEERCCTMLSRPSSVWPQWERGQTRRHLVRLERADMREERSVKVAEWHSRQLSTITLQSPV